MDHALINIGGNMGLMFARRRIEEAAKRAANKAAAQTERHKEAKERHANEGKTSIKGEGGKKDADSKGTK